VKRRPKPARVDRRWRRASLGLVVLVFAVIGLPYLPPVRTAVLSFALVAELLDMPVRPLAATVPQPERVTTVYGQAADRLDIYVPSGTDGRARLPAVVLALGVHPQPIDHPDVTRVATAICRLGVVVGVPDSTALRNLDITPAEPARLADAVMVVTAWPQVDASRVGLAGFSAGASIALIAAADERVSAQLRFVSSFGGYADAELLLVDVATRTAVIDGVTRPWQADAGIRADVLELMLGALEEQATRDDLRNRVEPFIGAESPPTGPLPADLADLEGDARAIYVLFAAGDRQTAQSAIDGLRGDLRARLSGISPVHYIDQIRAPVFLLHGEPDTAISVGHAEVLSERLGDRIARFTRFGEFGHGDPARQGLGPDDVGDVWELYLFLRDIVAATTE
jgi:dienelactone hydrolase